MASAISLVSNQQLQLLDRLVEFVLANLSIAAGEISASQASSGCKFTYNGDATALSSLAEVAFHRIQTGTTVSQIKIVPSGSAVADNSNYGTIVIGWRNGSGGSLNTLAAINTQVTGGGSWVAFAVKDMGSIANAVLPPGAVMTISVAKTASGIQLPAFVVQPTLT
jgi:hypothetical protein